MFNDWFHTPALFRRQIDMRVLHCHNQSACVCVVITVHCVCRSYHQPLQVFRFFRTKNCQLCEKDKRCVFQYAELKISGLSFSIVIVMVRERGKPNFKEHKTFRYHLIVQLLFNSIMLFTRIKPASKNA